MGKHKEKKRAPLQPQDNETAKIRESVLKVFRARVEQTDQGGALLVGPESQTKKSKVIEAGILQKSKNTHLKQNHKSTVEEVIEIRPTSGSMEVEQEMSPLSAHKNKRRRTRSERNKLRAGTSKTDYKTGDNAEFRKHVRRAQEITSNVQAHEKAVDASMNAITTSRLTRKLGLFNQGKKSGKIIRDCVSIPESVRAKTDEDIRQILNITQQSGAQKQSLDTLGKQFDSMRTQHQDSRQSHFKETTPLSVRSAYSFPRSSSPPVMTAMDVENKESIHSPPKLPESPDMKEVAELLISNIRPHHIFPARDYLKEVKDELCRILRQNQPRNSMDQTPLKTTPLCQGAVSSATVKRSLLHSLPGSGGRKDGCPSSAPRPSSASITTRNSTPLPTVGDGPSSVRISLDDYNMGPSGDGQSKLHKPQDSVTTIDETRDFSVFRADAKTLLEINDRECAKLELQHSSQSQESVKSWPRTAVPNKVCYHPQYTCTAPCCSRQEGQSCNRPHTYSHSQSPLQTYHPSNSLQPSTEHMVMSAHTYQRHPVDYSRMDVDHMELGLSYTEHHPSRSSHSFSQNRHSSLTNRQGTMNLHHQAQAQHQAQAVVAQYNYPAILLPRHHPDDSSLLHSSLAQQPAESMDILEFLDRQSGPGVSMDNPCIRSHSTRDSRHHGTSPHAWIATIQSPLQKPSLDTPTPPDPVPHMMY